MADPSYKDQRRRGSSYRVTYETSIAVILLAGIYVVYQGSVNIPERYWYLKMFMYVGSLGLVLAGINFGLQVATANSASDGIISSIVNFYNAATVVTIVAVSVIGLAILIVTFKRFLTIIGAVGKKDGESKTSESLDQF